MKRRASNFVLFACLCTLLFGGLTACTPDDDAGDGSPTETLDGSVTDASVTGTKDGASDGRATTTDSGDDDGGAATGEGGAATLSFTLGGTVSGLTGSGLALNDGVGDDLVIAGNGTFTFPHPLLSGTTFSVTVKLQPTNPVQTCKIAAGTGTIGAANVTSVSVNCDANKFFVSGTANGLVGTGLVLQDNGADNLSVTTGTFAFPTTVASGQPYKVTILTQPSVPTQSCTLANDSGTVNAADVTNVAVTCTTTDFTVGGTVTGLAAGNSVVLEDNGGDNLTVSANGAFTFPTSVASGASYAVTALTPTGPTLQSCVVGEGSAKVGSSNVTTVVVTCSNVYPVGGTISGLATGQSVVLENNAKDDLTVSANGTFTFATPLASGATYAVAVKTQPTSGTCHLFERTGTIGSNAVTSVTATCGIDYYVNAATGTNTGAGTSASPWLTITHAIAAIPAGGILNIAPGTYNAALGETFPIEPRSNQTLLGDIADKGLGAAPTVITGVSMYTPTGGELSPYVVGPVVVFPPTVTGAALRGLDIVSATPPPGYDADGVLVDAASATVADCTLSGATDVAVLDLNGSSLVLENDAIADGGNNLQVDDAATRITARGNTFTGAASSYNVRIGYNTVAPTGTNLDFGTAGSPGANTFAFAASGQGFVVFVPSAGIKVAGNTWHAGVQNASAAGTYATALVPGPVPAAAGNNYSLLVTGSSLQF